MVQLNCKIQEFSEVVTMTKNELKQACHHYHSELKDKENPLWLDAAIVNCDGW